MHHVLIQLKKSLKCGWLNENVRGFEEIQLRVVTLLLTYHDTWGKKLSIAALQCPRL